MEGQDPADRDETAAPASMAAQQDAHAGQLWKRFRTYTKRALAAEAGLSRSALRKQARLGYAKIAEYQARGLVHFHAVVRIDGPGGPNDPPPAWANTQLLETAIRTAARTTAISIPGPHAANQTLVLRWGGQLDIRPIHLTGASNSDGLEDIRVASYIAKYATKGTETAAAADRPIRTGYDLAMLDVPDHPRRIINACWTLAARPEYANLRLRQWAHMLGFRGHFLTKSRGYSTTLTVLRQTRADHRAAEARQRHGLPDLNGTNLITESQWTFAGSGHQPGEAAWADAIRERVNIARTIDEQRAAG